jgi:hypothetical protein
MLPQVRHDEGGRLTALAGGFSRKCRAFRPGHQPPGVAVLFCRGVITIPSRDCLVHTGDTMFVGEKLAQG